MGGGVVAVGDSITNECSQDLALGDVAALSWAERVAARLGEPLTVHARPGASSGLIRAELLPQVGDGYRLALAYVGVNNIISWRHWRRDDLADDLAVILSRLTDAADRVLVLGYPSNLGRSPLRPYGPALGRRLEQATATARRAAADAGALFVPCPPLTGHQVWIDRVHPTSLGHYTMARAALAALDVDLPPPDVGPLDPHYLAWRRREAVAFALRAPITGWGKWAVRRTVRA